MRASYVARLYLWAISKYGGAKCAEAMRKMLTTVALVATFEASFVNRDISPPYAVQEGNYVLAFGICGGISQILAIASVVLSFLLYIQLNFYDDDEIAWFALKFGTFISLPVACMILSLVLATIAINIRAYLTYGLTTWYCVFVATVLLGIPCVCGYMWMDPQLRSLRKDRANFHTGPTPV